MSAWGKANKVQNNEIVRDIPCNCRVFAYHIIHSFSCLTPKPSSPRALVGPTMLPVAPVAMPLLLTMARSSMLILRPRRVLSRWDQHKYAGETKWLMRRITEIECRHCPCLLVNNISTTYINDRISFGSATQSSVSLWLFTWLRYQPLGNINKSE